MQNILKNVALNGTKRGMIMSREIKFRVFIDYKIFYQDKHDEYGDNLTSIDICKKTITITGFHNCENVYRFEDEKVKLMQYTGIKDKNGKEIYEGDIIKYKFPYNRRLKHISPVFYMESQASYGVLDIYKNEIPLYKISTNNYFEVIGNIYENKNLLEENN